MGCVIKESEDFCCEFGAHQLDTQNETWVSVRAGPRVTAARSAACPWSAMGKMLSVDREVLK